MEASQHHSGDEEGYGVPEDIREAAFPLALRGYSCEAVDAYVRRVIAELEVRSSPRAAVRDALDRVGEQVGGILQRAREAAAEVTTAAHREAGEITARARTEATELVAQARAQADRERTHAESIVSQANAEAAETRRRAEEERTALQEQAQTRLAELRADTEALWNERLRLLDNTRETAARLEAAVTKAAMQIPRADEEPTAVRPAVVAVDPGGDVTAKRRPRAARPSRD